MEFDLGQKLNKIYLARKELETNLSDYHVKITEYISASDRPAKTETYIEKSSICLQKIIEKNDELKSLSMHSNNAAETINQPEFYLGSTTAKHDDVLGLAKNYFQIKHQEDQVATARTPTPSESVRYKKPLSQRAKIASMTSSERRREAALAKIRREEVERQVEAKLRLKKQEIQIQSMKGQLDLDVVVEESRQKLAEATIEEAEYLKDASETCELRRSRSKLAMAVQENQTEEERTRSWVNTQVEENVFAKFDHHEYSFRVTPFVKDCLSVGFKAIDVTILQDRFPHLQPIKPIVYNYSDVEMILG